MAVFKCKMCGAALNLQGDEKIIECEFCGTQQTLPRLTDETRENLYDRANHFRRNNDYDKATSIYEQLLNEDNTDAEAYWSIVLCRYGIEYVQDPATKKRVPTINRMQYTSILADEDYKSALQYADFTQKKIYESEGKAIDKIQKGILAISQAEEPFDVFICYKETDNNGRRTPDSVLAQELYYGLKEEGFKVFFARITLEDKLGSAYEPYIFAALNSAKVMVVLGTKAEHFKAVWVRNEWSRFLSLIKNGGKKALIPAYKDMDPYDLPDEFSHLQAQDMSKLGFMQDLIRGVKKLVNANKKKEAPQVVVQQTAPTGNISALLTRMQMSIEDGEFDQADRFAEQILNQDPTNAQAYLGKLMAEFKVKKREEFGALAGAMEKSVNYARLLRFGDKALIEEFNGYIQAYQESQRQASLEAKYKDAIRLMGKYEYEAAANRFALISEYKDSALLVEQCRKQAVLKAKAEIYNRAKLLLESGYKTKIQEAKAMFESIKDFKDSLQLSRECDKVCELLLQAKVQRKKKLIKIGIIAAVAIVVGILAVLASNVVQARAIENKYNDAMEYLESENYVEAQELFAELGDYKDADEQEQYAQSIIDGDYGIVVQNRGLTTFKIPDGVERIKAETFEDCTTLQTIVIPDSVTSIGDFAFYDCSSLTNITIPNSVTSIGRSAFYNCDSLTSVEIGDSVTSIGSSAFSWCSSLKNITIPDSVTSIGTTVFYGCSSLTSVEIGDSVTSIGDDAFHECSSLTSVVIGDSVTSIGEYAFSGCSSLTEIILPDSVTSIGYSAFEDCSRLTSVVIPDSVKSIGGEAFRGCSSLTEITLPFVGARAGKTANDTDQYPLGYIFGTSSYTGGTATEQYYYGSSTSSYTYSTYYIPTSLKKVTITGGNILYGAFYKCSSLTSVEIGNSVTSIGNSAFYDCDGLTSVEIGNSVTSIGDYAFYYCSSLTSVEIGNSVTSIGSSAFYYCSSLTEMTLPFVGATKNGMSYTHFGYIFGASSYSNNDNYVPTSLKKVTITGGSIGRSAFDNCSSLTSVEIGDSVTGIGNYAFSGCSSLTSVEIPDSVTSIGSSAFSGCSRLTIYCEAKSKPSGWSSFWNDDDCPVKWGYTGN